MAQVLLSPLLKVVFDKLFSLIAEEHRLQRGVHKEMGRLRTTLTIIQAVLEEAEEQQVKNKAVRIWLGELKDAAYDADDILDEFMTEALRRKIESEDHHHMMNKVHNFLSFPLLFHNKMGHKVKKIRERLDAIASERSQFHLEVIRDGRRGSETSKRLQSDSCVDESETFGREDDKTKLVDLLIKQCSEDVAVIPIVGMGGLGKTTLAQLAYNDPRVKSRFELRMWVCVSDDFDLRRVTRAIIEAATDGTCEELDMDLLQRRLQKQLGCKKFLLVLDDMWNENREECDRLKHYLRGAQGSRIIVTTRSKNVALIMGTLPPLELVGLSEEDCWSLFKKRAFAPQEEDRHPNLITIGKEFGKMCGGLPLAAKTLGSLMRFKREETEWIFLKESEVWSLHDQENGILPALRLSYYHLPPHLKQCFAYCSLFPKDYEFEKDDLIQLWMAEGLIQASKDCKQMEDIGKEYFNNLLWRSFFQDAKRDEYGNVTQCKMHDLMHDLALDVAGDECLIAKVDKAVSIPKRTRHLSLMRGDVKNQICPDAINKAKKLRTLLLIVDRSYIHLPRNIYSHLMCLRVLDLRSASCCEEKLVSIGKLTHLRYLAVSISPFKIPESFSTLVNLQTLKLSSCNLRELPKDMRKMVSLRHIEIDFDESLFSMRWQFRRFNTMPVQIEKLKCLQTLPIFAVGTSVGCRITELKDLNLQGRLFNKKLENVKDANDALAANLKLKQNLHTLGFSWRSYDSDAVFGEKDEQILEGLEPHPNLKRLLVDEYAGIRFPRWISDLLLPNLTEIALANCRRCESLPSFGQLPFLKVLTICGMDGVKCIDTASYGKNVTRGFPSLKELAITNMPNLEEILVGSERKIFPHLVRLRVERCPKLANLPHLPSIESLWLGENNETLLRSLTNLTSLMSLSVVRFAKPIEDRLLQNLSHLSDLSISECQELRYLSQDLKILTALLSLKIFNCQKLVSLESPTSLHEMVINGCNGLTSLEFEGLTSLQRLEIHRCENLGTLLGEMQHVTALQDLNIGSSPQLASLPQGMRLLNLQRLDISGLDKLTSLPDALQNATKLQYLEITACPRIMGNLKSLNHLRIEECPHLQRRCQKEKGEDWHKIAHIPDIRIRIPVENPLKKCCEFISARRKFSNLFG